MTDSPKQWQYARAIRPAGYRYFETVDLDQELGSGLVLDPVFNLTHPQELRRLLLALPPDLLAVDWLLLRGLPRIMWPEAGQLTELAKEIELRTSKRPLIGEIRVEILSAPTIHSETALDETTAVALLKAVRRIELEAQLAWNGAVMRPENAHFELPSGAHASGFVRVGDAFTDITTVERISDWLAGDAEQAVVLAADTWALLPVLQQLSERRIRAGKPRPTIVTFRSYPSTVHFEDLISSIEGQIAGEKEGRLLFILSARSSSGLLNNVMRLVAPSLVRRDRIIVRTLVDTNPTGTEAWTTIPGITRYDVDSGKVCELCRDPKRSFVVHIDSRKYTPIVTRNTKAQMLRHEFASAHHALWEAASRTKATRLHWDDVVGESRRHHTVGLDVAALLKDPEFRRTAMAAVRRHSPLTDVVVMPTHAATEELSSFICEAFHKPKIVRVPAAALQTDDLNDRAAVRDELRKELRKSRTSVRHFLILDDAIIQGRTVRAIHRLLQSSLREEKERNYAITAFAVLARPSTESRWQRLQKSLRQGRGELELGSAAKIYLPDEPERCPWCQERDILGKILNRLEQVDEADLGTQWSINSGELAQVKTWIAHRLQHLTTAGSGNLHIRRGLYLCGSSGDFVTSVEETISRNSLFGERLDAAAAFAAVTESLQALRNTWDISLTGSTYYWDLPKILTAYHDPLLSAAFLRAAYPEEMGVPDTSQEFMDALEEISFASPNPELTQSPLLAAEVEWALISGVLPEDFSARIDAKVRPVLHQSPELSGILRVLQVLRTPNRQRIGEIQPSTPTS